MNRLADVALSKQASPTTVAIGDTVTFTVEAVNNGPNVATERDRHRPAAARPAADGRVGDPGYLRVRRPPASGPSAGSASARARSSRSPRIVTQSGAITNIATNTTGNEPDPDTSNDTASATVNGDPAADVGVPKSVDNPTPGPDDPSPSRFASPTMVPSPATGIVVEDVLPAGLTLGTATPSQGTYDMATGLWTVGDLAPVAFATLTLETTASTSALQVNTARKTAQTEPDPNPANDQSSVTLNGAGTADVAVAKAVSSPVVALGELVSFTITATNLGPEAATNVVLTDLLPPGLRLVSAVPSGAFDPVTGRWTVGSLALSQSQVLVLTVEPTLAGNFTNTATRTSQDEPDPNPVERHRDGHRHGGPRRPTCRSPRQTIWSSRSPGRTSPTRSSWRTPAQPDHERAGHRHVPARPHRRELDLHAGSRLVLRAAVAREPRWSQRGGWRHRRADQRSCRPAAAWSSR